ncbi:hypothetical protein [Thermosulfurimonas sp. F29]|uniref:hypothetical protein n=1 Tax=Thermosulfurimonas sp. F29 TaxID=2867247 RepID=UPI001C83782E|nr:hypothetical protein [Thermosulfurimonas sp. F29]MBX6422778.1 hypothetical protein [Thermosulfurimonas sp. F29]
MKRLKGFFSTKMMALVFLLALFLGTGLRASPIPYYWDDNWPYHIARFYAYGSVTAYDHSANEYVFNVSGGDHADTAVGIWAHDPPAEKSLSKHQSKPYGPVEKTWAASLNVRSFLNEGGVSGLSISGGASTNMFVNAHDYAGFYGTSQQYGYFFLDRPLTLRVTEFLHYGGENFNEEEFDYANYLQGRWDLSLYRYEDSNGDGEPDTLKGQLWGVHDEINRRGITSESDYVYTYTYFLEPGWYSISATFNLSGRAYQGDTISAEGGLHLSAVPLPPAGFLLLPGLGVLVGVRRRLRVS